MGVFESSRRQHGFTLIELLVVISIISLLVAILLPSLKKARETAVSLQCLNLVRQLGFKFENYYLHNKDKFPAPMLKFDGITDTNDYRARQFGSWPVRVLDRDENTQMLYCPKDPYTEKVVPGDYADKHFKYVSYRFRHWLAKEIDLRPAPVRITDLMNLSSTPLLFEHVDRHYTGFATGTETGSPLPAIKLNSLYADGHGALWNMSNKWGNGIFDPNAKLAGEGLRN